MDSADYITHTLQASVVVLLEMDSPPGTSRFGHSDSENRRRCSQRLRSVSGQILGTSGVFYGRLFLPMRKSIDSERDSGAASGD